MLSVGAKPLAIVILLAPIVLSGQQSNPLIEQMVGLAHVVPSEFGADAILMLAEHAQPPGRDKRIELIEIAFGMASGTRFANPFGFVSASDARIPTAGFAAGSGLDAISLKCRAVKCMLSLDRAKARQLFEGIILPVRKRKCKEAARDGFGPYYQTAAQIYQHGFSREEIKKEEPIRFIESLIRTVTSPVQIDPVAQLIIDIKPTGGTLASLVSLLGASFEHVNQDDRSFGNALDVNQRIYDLAKMCVKDGVPSEPLIRAYRKYLVAHYTGPRCADNITWLASNSKGTRRADLDPIARVFHGLARPPYVGAELPVFSDEEMQPSKVEDGPEVFTYWTSAKAAALHARADRLLQLDPIARNVQIATMLSQLEDWTPADEVSAADYFHQRCQLSKALLAAAPTEAQPIVAGAYAGYLHSSDMQKESPAEWYLHARDMMLNHPHEMARLSSPIVWLYNIAHQQIRKK